MKRPSSLTTCVRRGAAVALAVATLVAVPVIAQQMPGTTPAPGAQGGAPGMGPGMGSGMGPGMMGQGMPMRGPMADPTARAFQQSVMQMQHTMMQVPLTGNADRDFANLLMQHHQGAIDLARLEQQHGQDPDLKRMAGTLIQEQEKEIEQLKTWLGRHPPASGSSQ